MMMLGGEGGIIGMMNRKPLGADAAHFINKLQRQARGANSTEDRKRALMEAILTQQMNQPASSGLPIMQGY